jgi:hypothetical protein
MTGEFAGDAGEVESEMTSTQGCGQVQEHPAETGLR